MRASMAFASALAVLLSAAAAAENTSAQSEYGRVVISNHAARSGLAPVVFDHWLHRAKFTCRLCHIDIGFAMSAGGTGITAATNRQGYHCGACHNGKRPAGDKAIFAACAENAPADARARCNRCHSHGVKGAREIEYAAFTEKLPKTPLGGGIDWEDAEARGLIKPVDTLDDVSLQRPRIRTQKDFSIEAKASWMGDVIFSHKKHATWNGCEVCHPDIFPSVQKGGKPYSMFQIIEGRYCGACHDKVAFPLQDCKRCHVKPVQTGTGAPR